MLRRLAKCAKALISETVDFFEVAYSKIYDIKYCWWCNERFTCVFHFLPVSKSSLEYERGRYGCYGFRYIDSTVLKEFDALKHSASYAAIKPHLSDLVFNRKIRKCPRSISYYSLLILDFLNPISSMLNRKVRRGIRIPWERLRSYKRISDIELTVHSNSNMPDRFGNLNLSDYVCSVHCFHATMLYSFTQLRGSKLRCKFNKLDSKSDQV